MGCASSKLDDLPAVQLCRGRLDYLNQSLQQRYSLSECHVSYIHSLHSVGVSLHRFFDSSSSLPIPTLVIPTTTTIKEHPPAPPHQRSSSSGHLSHSNSNSGSHLHFHSESDSDHDHGGHEHHEGHLDVDSDSDSDMDTIHHHHHGEADDEDSDVMPRGVRYGMTEEVVKPYPVQYPYPFPYPYTNSGGPGVGGGLGMGGGYQMNFMKKHVTPSVLYEQKPPSAETNTIQFDQASSSNSAPSYYYNQMSNGNPYDFNGGGPNYGGVGGGPNFGGGGPNYGGGGGGPNFGGGGGGYGGGGGFMSYGGGVASTSKPAPPPPPPPPPPAISAWDFLNPFESIEANYPSYTPSRDSREVREEEGIPDLEDEDFEHEVVKEVHGHQKLVDDHVYNQNMNHKHKNKHVNVSNGASTSKGGGERKSDVRKGEVEEDEEEGDVMRASEARASAALAEEENPVEYEVHMVDKKVVGDEAKSEHQGKGGRGGFKNVFEVVKEIQVQFERAAASGGELAKVLEVGKLRYQRKNTAFQVSTKMLNVITPSLPSTSKESGGTGNVEEEVQLRSLNLSATLQKLYLWEKKLFEEVKAEEKMRVDHDRKVKKLKNLNERGAEVHKIESTRGVVMSLSTKIRIAIQIVDRISAKINKVRDEELWPQLNELIQGLSRMWKAMLECHHIQCQAIEGARGLDAIAFPDNPSDAHLEATLQLEHDLINWTCRFTEWVGAQRGFVRALNSWLLKCLFYEPEMTADGPAPFSPGRAGAPPVFVICNQWNQSLERISETSEKEVIDSMRVFAMMVWHFRERDKGEMKQRMTANREIERKVKNLDREDVKMQKEIQALDKKMILTSGASDGLSLSGHVVYQSDTSSKTSLQGGLRHIFEALDRFTTDSVKVYEELLQRSEEVVNQHGRNS